MEVELDPDQPPEIARAVAELLGSGAPEPHPWWRAGIDEALDTETP